MSALGPLLVGVGVADLVAGGLAGDPVRRPLGGAAAGALAAAATHLALTGRPVPALVAGARAAAVCLVWLLARVRADRLPAGVPLSGLAVSLAAAALLVPTDRVAGAPLARSLDRLEVTSDPAAVMLLLGGAVTLLATANAVVRLVLDAAGPDVARSADRLKGGRLIGAIERLIVAGLTAAGQPAAAALVIAAKAIVRFPELSSTARRDELAGAVGSQDLDPLARVDAVTEYFLLGSLTSLGVALLVGWLV